MGSDEAPVVAQTVLPIEEPQGGTRYVGAANVDLESFPPILLQELRKQRGIAIEAEPKTTADIEVPVEESEEEMEAEQYQEPASVAQTDILEFANLEELFQSASGLTGAQAILGEMAFEVEDDDGVTVFLPTDEVIEDEGYVLEDFIEEAAVDEQMVDFVLSDGSVTAEAFQASQIGGGVIRLQNDRTFAAEDVQVLNTLRVTNGPIVHIIDTLLDDSNTMGSGEAPAEKSEEELDGERANSAAVSAFASVFGDDELDDFE